MGRPRSTRLLLAALLAMLAAAAAGCATTGRTPAPTLPGAAELSLAPASDAAAPPSVDPSVLELPADVPPEGPPTGVAPPPTSPAWTGEPGDADGFVAAYREAFGVPDLDAAAVQDAGARLCAYLEPHADGNGTVDVAAALTDADTAEPGYPAETWALAFALASRFYCPQLTLDSAAVQP